jgi:oligoribonuclease
MFAQGNIPYEKKGREYLLWLDLECTGSQTESDYILEIGALISDRALNELESKQIVLPITSEMEDSLPDVVRTMHTVNGLLDDCKKKVLEQGENMFILPEQMLYNEAVKEADRELSDWVRKFNGSNHMPLAGSGISHYDRAFIKRQLPLFNKRLTYFNMDIGTVRRWMEFAGVQLTANVQGATMNKTHRALDDARVHKDEAKRWLIWARDR